MRILHAVHFFLPNHVAGVEVYTDHLTAELAKRNTVGLLHGEIDRRRPNHQLRSYSHGSVQAYEVVNNHWFRSFERTYRDPAMRPVLSRVIDDFAPDVVHVQHLMGLSTILLEEVHRRRVPIVMTAHDHWFECAAGGQRFHPSLGRCDELDANRCGACTAHQSRATLLARECAERVAAWRSTTSDSLAEGQRNALRGDTGPPDGDSGWRTSRLHALARSGSRALRVSTPRQAKKIESRWSLLRDAAALLDRVLVPSRYLADQLIAFGMPEERISLLDHGFAMPQIDEANHSEPRSLPRVARRFGFLGSLVRHKGLHVLLEAFESMPEGVELEIGGSPTDDRLYVAELERRFRHPGIHFRGRIAPSRVPSLLREIDCLVVPSIWFENAPLVIREAHLAGRPVIASRLGGHVELLESGGGLLYAADSSAALEACLRRVCDEPGLLSKLVVGARPIKSIEQNAIELEQIYDSLVG